ncbi:RDD family protein [Simiduia litorea]|uniref:RDD family protein n=1 Tax=Simiduia litorea TaxID=1435348 RepID=UPI0036F3D437
MELQLDLERTDPKYAGFWIRFVAFVIDSVVFGIGLAVPFYFLFDNPLVGFDYSAPVDQQMLVLTAFVQQSVAKGGVYLAIYIFCWMKFLGTPGKLVLNTQIVDAKTFAPLSFGQSLIRYLGYFVSIFTCFLGFIWVGIDAKKRGFHDLMAGSVVIYKPDAR